MANLNTSKYYRLQGDSAILTTEIKPVIKTHSSLIRGSKIDEAYEDLPYIYTFHDTTGNPLIDFFEENCIMSKKMLNIFLECGAENIQVLPLQLMSKNTDEITDEYVIFNLLEFVSNDKIKTSNSLVFRIKESLNQIIVHESIAVKLRENNIKGIILTAVV